MKILILLLFIVSCAQQKLILKNNEMTPFKSFSKKTNVPFKLKTISFDSVLDKRESTESVGFALTGVKYQKTPISLETNVESYVQNYLTKSLVKRGILVSDSDGIKTSIYINDFWVEEIVEKYQPEKAKCKVNLTLYMSEGKSTWQGNYWIEIISPGDMSDGTEKIAPTLSSCMNEIVEKIVKDDRFISFIK